jgi:coenzyme F420-0:L-glutamate ligase / coenzyme F420-1:gamma-L-glutamate ligase
MNKQERPLQTVSSPTRAARFVALAGVPFVEPGDDIVQIILAALQTSREKLRNGDVLIIAQKIISKAQGRLVRLDTVTTSVEARALAREVQKDPRLVELILRESVEVVRARPGLLIVAHKLGFIVANGGIDFSNVEQHAGKDETALLLPENPDLTCAELRSALKTATGAEVGVVINDSHGRAFRNGTVGVAIGAAGFNALADLRGAPDIFGRRFHSTQVGAADEIASAASLLMGQGDECRPIVLARGLPVVPGDGDAAQLVRDKDADLFRGNRPLSGTLLHGRRSIRHYKPQPVPDVIIEEILQGAVCAPSAHNRQPWRFAVLTDAHTRHRLAHVMADRLRDDRLRDGDRIEVIERDCKHSIERIVGAPLAIVVCLTMEDMDSYPDERRRACERQMAVQSTAMAIQNILLGAQAVGLGACVMCAPLFCPEAVRSGLNLDPAWEPQGLVTLGFPATDGKPFRRKPLADVVRVVRVDS